VAKAARLDIGDAKMRRALWHSLVKASFCRKGGIFAYFGGSFKEGNEEVAT
jgi:hypothetical protein